MPGIKPTNIDEYIQNAPAEAQEKLREIRSILKQVAPGAVEAIKWGYPVFERKRILFSISAHKNHLNFMPTGPAINHFTEEIAAFEHSKDTIKFHYNKPLPVELIIKIASYRVWDVQENDAKWMY